MIKKIIIFIALIVGLITLVPWFKCGSFADPLHYSQFDMVLKLHEAVHNDIGFSAFAARAFHNKIALSAILIFNSYLYFWDIRFGALLFSLVGYFGILCGFWYLTKSKMKFKWWIFSAFIVLPFIEIFHFPLPYHQRLISLTLPYQAFSVFGLWKFIEADKWKRLLFLIILITLSICYYFTFVEEIFLNCYK